MDIHELASLLSLSLLALLSSELVKYFQMKQMALALADPLPAPSEQFVEARSTCSVLLVEDEPGIAQFVVETLRDTGYQVQHVWDGDEAIRRLSDPSDSFFCLIILDMMLPRVDGLTVLTSLARYTASPPVLAISASPEQLRLARSAGARESISKPFELDHLLAAVARYCGDPGL